MTETLMWDLEIDELRFQVSIAYLPQSVNDIELLWPSRRLWYNAFSRMRYFSQN
jgi:hypothetical protein